MSDAAATVREAAERAGRVTKKHARIIDNDRLTSDNGDVLNASRPGEACREGLDGIGGGIIT